MFFRGVFHFNGFFCVFFWKLFLMQLEICVFLDSRKFYFRNLTLKWLFSSQWKEFSFFGRSLVLKRCGFTLKILQKMGNSEVSQYKRSKKQSESEGFDNQNDLFALCFNLKSKSSERTKKPNETSTPKLNGSWFHRHQKNT